jgi:hypothetical protein
MMPLGWKVVSVDSEETGGADNSAARAIDGDSSTIWHTRWNADQRQPHSITVDMGAAHRIGGLTYLPRQDGLLNGVVEKYNTRVVHVNLQPQAITSQFAAMGQPVMPDWMPMRSAYNRLSYGVFRRTTWYTAQGSLGNRIRKLSLDMPNKTGRSRKCCWILHPRWCW